MSASATQSGHNQGMIAKAKLSRKSATPCIVPWNVQYSVSFCYDHPLTVSSTPRVIYNKLLQLLHSITQYVSYKNSQE